MSADKVTTENAIFKYNDIVIYSDDINLLCDEYINDLPAPDMIYKSACFTGLLDYIYRHCIKRILNITKGTGNNGGYNYNVLDDIFNNIYMPLCYKYNYVPTLYSFSSMLKIPSEHFTDLKNGFYRNGNGNVNKKTSQIVKNWHDTCKAATVGKALNDSQNIGAIFVSKAVYGLSDVQTVKIETASLEAHETAAEIAARHQAEALPEVPEI